MRRDEKSVSEVVKKNRTVVIDASGLILGRLSSYVAKRLLIGERVIVVNAENAVISGSKVNIVEKFRKKLGTRTLGSQKKAPKHPRRPETYVRRVIRGMLPWKRKAKGKAAYSKLIVYVGFPEAVGKRSTQTFPEAKKAVPPFMTVGELLKIFGWKNQLEEIHLNAK